MKIWAENCLNKDSSYTLSLISHNYFGKLYLQNKFRSLRAMAGSIRLMHSRSFQPMHSSIMKIHQWPRTQSTRYLTLPKFYCYKWGKPPSWKMARWTIFMTKICFSQFIYSCSADSLGLIFKVVYMIGFLSFLLTYFSFCIFLFAISNRKYFDSTMVSITLGE